MGSGDKTTTYQLVDHRGVFTVRSDRGVCQRGSKGCEVAARRFQSDSESALAAARNVDCSGEVVSGARQDEVDTIVVALL